MPQDSMDTAHANQIIDHHNDQESDVHDTLRRHAQNDDHDSMVSWVKSAGRTLGIPITATTAVGVAWWLIKHYKKK